MMTILLFHIEALSLKVVSNDSKRWIRVLNRGLLFSLFVMYMYHYWMKQCIETWTSILRHTDYDSILCNDFC